jgi:hypothetical protein
MRKLESRIETVFRIESDRCRAGGVGGGCKNTYSSMSHQDTGGDAPPWLMRKGEPFSVTS